MQLALSAAAAIVGFAVYRVQADKLFLEMRDKRIAAMDGYRKAIGDQLMHARSVRDRDRLGEYLRSERMYALHSAQWEAEIEVKRWFGEEVVALMKPVHDATSLAFRKCVEDARSGGAPNIANDELFAGAAALQAFVDAAHPYVMAGRRGLPMGFTTGLRIRAVGRKVITRRP